MAIGYNRFNMIIYNAYCENRTALEGGRKAHASLDQEAILCGTPPTSFGYSYSDEPIDISADNIGANVECLRCRNALLKLLDNIR